MRPGFGELKRIRQRAKDRVENNGQSFIERWWSEKYSLPATHKLFVSRPLAVHAQEFYEDLAVELRDVRVQLKDPNLSERVSTQERESFLVSVLNGVEEDFDPDFDPDMERWISQMARGEQPDYRDKLPKTFFPKPRSEG